jgi:hypothetical protein
LIDWLIVCLFVCLLLESEFECQRTAPYTQSKHNLETSTLPHTNTPSFNFFVSHHQIRINNYSHFQCFVLYVSIVNTIGIVSTLQELVHWNSTL